MTGTGAGEAVAGFIANTDSPFNPVTDPYPTTNPTSGFTQLNESFAGIIEGAPPGGGATLELYCVDLNTMTAVGAGYQLGAWTDDNVPNIGYVTQILDTYYPNTDEPAGLTNVNDKAAAVQAAIWFFSDRYVLSTIDPLHDVVASIVAAVIAAGPVTKQPAPSLAITPPSATGSAGSAVGPFTVTSSAPATVSATGAEMYSDASATTPIPNGTTVSSGTKIWLESSSPSSAILQASAEATVPTGNVYLYDHNVPSLPDAQKLILAETATLETTVTASAQFQATGSLVINKTLAGPAAGSQGRIVIHVVCNGTALSPDFVIAAGSPAGTDSTTYDSIPAGSMCTVTETSDGSSSSVTVTVKGSGQQVQIPSGGQATANLTDTYESASGSVVVNKTIAGAAAGSQAQVVIQVVCAGKPLSPDFVIPAGTGAGTVSRTYGGLSPGESCTVTETSNGSTSTVSVAVVGSGQTVTVPAGGTAVATLTDDYTTSPSTSSSGTLPFTGLGSGAMQLRDAGLAAIAGGLFLTLLGGRRRRRSVLRR